MPQSNASQIKIKMRRRLYGAASFWISYRNNNNVLPNLRSKFSRIHLCVWYSVGHSYNWWNKDNLLLDKTPELQQLVEDYYQMKAVINPLHYGSALKILKNINISKKIITMTINNSATNQERPSNLSVIYAAHSKISSGKQVLLLM